MRKYRAMDAIMKAVDKKYRWVLFDQKKNELWLASAPYQLFEGRKNLGVWFDLSGRRPQHRRSDRMKNWVVIGKSI